MVAYAIETVRFSGGVIDRPRANKKKLCRKKYTLTHLRFSIAFDVKRLRRRRHRVETLHRIVWCHMGCCCCCHRRCCYRRKVLENLTLDLVDVATTFWLRAEVSARRLDD